MLEQLKTYKPFNEQEEVDKKLIVDFIDRNPDAYDRHNLVGHLTSSAIVVNERLDKVLFIHHNIYNAWGWVGGHNDGDRDFLRVALKEAQEETGVQSIEPYDQEILGLDVIYVENHIKNGVYVPDHVHLNVTYLLVADETDELVVNDDENSDVRWFNIDTVLDVVDEPRMIPVYTKLFQRIEEKKNKR
jgi:8-oxo-dGTP pyrophosphatase MutT (NUDIX family)